MSRKLSLTAAAVALAATAPGASAAAPAADPVLPAVTRTVSAPVLPGTSCAMDAIRTEKQGATTYVAPIAGYLNVTLDGAGDWDLALRDRNGARLEASQGTDGHELIQRWVKPGDRLTAVACRRPGATGTAKIAFNLVVTKPAVQQGTTRRIRVDVTSQRQVAQLEAMGLDVTHDQSPTESVVLVNGDDQLALLKGSGMTYKVLDDDVFATDLADLRSDAARSTTAKTRAAAAALPSGRTTYRTYDDYQAELKKLVADNPGLVRSVSIGKSYQGRDINGVEIANDVNGDDGRPVFFLMGVHHAREWPAGEAAMEMANLLTKSKSDPRIAKLLATERVVIVPLINPDGFNVSRASFSPTDNIVDQGDPGGAGSDYGQTVEAVAPPGGFGAYRRKNCDAENAQPMQPCESAYGVDNNRNYGNLWGGSGGSPDPTSQSYHGMKPRSEPETQAVFNYVRTHHVTTLITLHTVAGLVLRPPGLAQLGLAPDEKRMKELGDAMGTATGYTSQYSWQLYDTAGTTEDDTYSATGGYGYTYELGSSTGLFHGPYMDSVVNEWTGNNDHSKNQGGVQEGLLLAAETVNNNPDHAILTGAAPAGKVLHLFKKFQTKSSDYCVTGVDPAVDATGNGPTCAGTVQPAVTLNDTLDSKTTIPADGKFEWHIDQSTRPFVNGGATLITLKDDPTPAATIQGTPGAPNDVHMDKFTLKSSPAAMTVTLRPTAAEDYDIELLKDGKSLGTSGNPPGMDESITVRAPQQGEYVVKVTYFAAATGSYTTTVTTQTETRTITTGTKEAYTLTCEEPGGKVLSSQSLIIDRGQTIAANGLCTSSASLAPPVVSPPGKGKPIKPKTPLVFRVLGVRLKASHKGEIIVRARCPKDLTALCKGKVTVRGKLSTAKSAKTTTVARGTFKTKPNSSGKVRMTLSRAAFAALKQRGTIPVSIAATGTSGKKRLSSTRKLTLRKP